jgi:UDP-N-acetylmuramoyl-tripeptide--D-alanyl-D-alanine ligase
LHAALAEHPAMAAVDSVVCVGERMRALHDALPRARRGDWFPDAKAAAARLRRYLDAGDVVMVKGSLSMKMAAVVEAVKAMGVARDASAAPEEG